MLDRVAPARGLADIAGFRAAAMLGRAQQNASAMRRYPHSLLDNRSASLWIHSGTIEDMSAMPGNRRKVVLCCTELCTRIACGYALRFVSTIQHVMEVIHCDASRLLTTTTYIYELLLTPWDKHSRATVIRPGCVLLVENRAADERLAASVESPGRASACSM
ncbi:hypothetical protein KDW49_06835 [Burkholderia dolosa]|uniref:hypothetical protein n=1 Tax=Burkholderia dolosa TaxID=152500 RepID=UPI001BA1E7C3|nr:hypothetical protein [Burkholderia dolosa]MBR8300427.1 hypothetical protein [Burkholderia dolosa]